MTWKSKCSAKSIRPAHHLNFRRSERSSCWSNDGEGSDYDDGEYLHPPHHSETSWMNAVFYYNPFPRFFPSSVFGIFNREMMTMLSREETSSSSLIFF